jgi:hypothetical protein
MWHVYEVEQEARLRQSEHQRWAVQQRLARAARAAADAQRGPGAPGWQARLLHRLGRLLVDWGSRLQGTPAPERPPATAVSAGWR